MSNHNSDSQIAFVIQFSEIKKTIRHSYRFLIDMTNLNNFVLNTTPLQIIDRPGIYLCLLSNTFNTSLIVYPLACNRIK